MTPPFIFSLIILIVSPLSMLLAREDDDFISGRVTDDVGTGVPYANIYLKNGNQGTSSDRDGRFYLEAVGISDSTVIITHSAFDTDSSFYTSYQLILTSYQLILNLMCY